jgi:hypothetical protein
MWWKRVTASQMARKCRGGCAPDFNVVVATIADIPEYCCAHIEARRGSLFAKLCVDISPYDG